MTEKLARYRSAEDPLPPVNRGWPLFGPGTVNLGCEGDVREQPLPTCGPDELLVRHDAVGLCFSDVKEIDLGAHHPRLSGLDLAANPLIPGHEASMTVVAAGAKLRGRYRPGERFAVQPDVWSQGQSIPYGYRLPGAFQQYNTVGSAVVNGDAGSYLIPIPSAMTYAGAALSEPWACVEASYRMIYRTNLQPGGTAWFLGGPGTRFGYDLSAIWEIAAGPGRVILSEVPTDLADRLRVLAQRSGAEVIECAVDDVAAQGVSCDDILVLDGDALIVDCAAPALAIGGVLAIARATPMSAPMHIDLGRLHYDDILYVGTTGTDLDAAYRRTLPRSELLSGGTAWILGGGGPMGRMHLQRALESRAGPRRALVTDISPQRVDDVAASFGALARERGVILQTLHATHDSAEYRAALQAVADEGGVHDVEVMATDPRALLETLPYLGVGAVVNLFAGLQRGTTAPVEGWQIYGPQQVRFVGHSGSGLADQAAIIERASSGQLAPERSMAALGGLRQIPHGIRAMKEAALPGKIVIFPAILDFPLTALADLRNVLPRVYDKLADGRVWTSAAEAEFLSALLPD